MQGRKAARDLVEEALVFLRLAIDKLAAAGAPDAHRANLRTLHDMLSAEVAHGFYEDQAGDTPGRN